VLRVVQIQGEGFFVFGVQANVEPYSWHIRSIQNCQKQIRNEKGGSKTQNNKPQPILEHPKTSFSVALLLL
jgi:hypothetical protein